MKAKIVYGAPCSGKTTYVRDNAGNSDFVFDYDRLLCATTDRTMHIAEKHALHWLILDLRKVFVESAKSAGNVDVFWMVCTWSTDYIKGLFEGIDTEEIFIEATKKECYDRLDDDESRPDKAEWRLVIDKWFDEHSKGEAQVKGGVMNKFWNWTKNEETGERELAIDRAIGGDDFVSWLFDEITPKDFREELNSGDGDIVVRINSEGGDVFAANEIYNMLKEYRGKVRVVIDAIAASAASIIAMSGDVIEISPVGMIVIHNPWTGTVGDADEFKTVANQLESIKENIINAYELKTHLSRTKLAKMMDEETFIHARKAVELGFADKIIGEENFSAETASDSMSSRQQVANCIMNALRIKNKSAAPDNRVDAAPFQRRLLRKKP